MAKDVSLCWSRPIVGGATTEQYDGPIKVYDSGLVDLLDENRQVPVSRIHFIDYEDED